jgi:HAD superfamily hydrolase (TIGR01490 family)
MNLALFDFDGTITTVGTFPLFCRYVVSRPRLIVGGLLISPWLVGYKVGLVSDRRMCAVLAKPSFVGQRRARIDALGDRFAREVIPGVLRPQAIERITWHKSRGDVVAVVSASLSTYLAPWCNSMDVDLICVELASKYARLTGGYVDGDCCAEDKVRRIRRRYDLRTFETIYAYGDSDDDAAMLSLATEKYFRGQRMG